MRRMATLTAAYRPTSRDRANSRMFASPISSKVLSQCGCQFAVGCLAVRGRTLGFRLPPNRLPWVQVRPKSFRWSFDVGEERYPLRLLLKRFSEGRRRLCGYAAHPRPPPPAANSYASRSGFGVRNVMVDGITDEAGTLPGRRCGGSGELIRQPAVVFGEHSLRGVRVDQVVELGFLNAVAEGVDVGESVER